LFGWASKQPPTGVCSDVAALHPAVWQCGWEVSSVIGAAAQAHAEPGLNKLNDSTRAPRRRIQQSRTWSEVTSTSAEDRQSPTLGFLPGRVRSSRPAVARLESTIAVVFSALTGEWVGVVVSGAQGHCWVRGIARARIAPAPPVGAVGTRRCRGRAVVDVGRVGKSSCGKGCLKCGKPNCDNQPHGKLPLD